MYKAVGKSNPQGGINASVRGINFTVRGGQASDAVNPLELLLASLSSCLILTLQAAAKNRNWDLKEVTVSATLEYEGKDEIPHFKEEISIRGPLNKQQIDKLNLIAHKCEVYRLLVDTGKKVTVAPIKHLP